MTIRMDQLLTYAPVSVLAGTALVLIGAGVLVGGLSRLVELVGEAQED